MFFPKLLFCKIPAAMPSFIFQQVVFHTQNAIFVFHDIRKFGLIQNFNSHHWRGLMLWSIEIKKKTLQWSYNVIASKWQFAGFSMRPAWSCLCKQAHRQITVCQRNWLCSQHKKFYRKSCRRKFIFSHDSKESGS